ncbi:GNAT family N-acetyltransferase [Apiospora arundinis]
MSASVQIPTGYTLVEGFPAVEDYMHLRPGAAVSGAWYGCYVAETTSPAKPVAMGRIIGDGGWYFIIADMAVLPEHQRRGLGDAILKTLMERIRTHAAKGDAYVTLFADIPGRRLYEKNGFKEAMPREMGMDIVLKDAGTSSTEGDRTI